MPSKGYRFAVEWIALNDGPGDSDALDPEAVQDLVSIALVADMFGKSTLEVAQAVVKYRQAAQR